MAVANGLSPSVANVRWRSPCCKTAWPPRTTWSPANGRRDAAWRPISTRSSPPIDVWIVAFVPSSQLEVAVRPLRQPVQHHRGRAAVREPERDHVHDVGVLAGDRGDVGGDRARRLAEEEPDQLEHVDPELEPEPPRHLAAPAVLGLRRPAERLPGVEEQEVPEVGLHPIWALAAWYVAMNGNWQLTTTWRPARSAASMSASASASVSTIGFLRNTWHPASSAWRASSRWSPGGVQMATTSGRVASIMASIVSNTGISPRPRRAPPRPSRTRRRPR